MMGGLLEGVVRRLAEAIESGILAKFFGRGLDFECMHLHGFE